MRGEVIARQAVAVALGELGIAADLRDQASEAPRGVEASLGTVGGMDGLGHIEDHASRLVVGAELPMDVGQRDEVGGEQHAIGGCILAQQDGLALLLDGTQQRGPGLDGLADPVEQRGPRLQALPKWLRTSIALGVAATSFS